MRCSLPQSPEKLMKLASSLQTMSDLFMLRWRKLFEEQRGGFAPSFIKLRIIHAVLEFHRISDVIVEFARDDLARLPVAPFGVAHLVRAHAAAHGGRLSGGFAVIIGGPRMLREGGRLYAGLFAAQNGH